MDFEIKLIITTEYNSGDHIKVDFNDLENYIKAKLSDKDFGSSVTKFYWGFELFKFDGGFASFFKNDITTWKHSIKSLVSNSHFDWNTFKDLNKADTLALMKGELLNAVDRVETMKRKPKDFNYKGLRQELSLIFDDYLTDNNNAISEE